MQTTILQLKQDYIFEYKKREYLIPKGTKCELTANLQLNEKETLFAVYFKDVDVPLKWISFKNEPVTTKFELIEGQIVLDSVE